MIHHEDTKDTKGTAQLLTYLKVTGHRVGLLINFNVSLLRNGLGRVLVG
jgi:PD-(D/E)XK nuclease superfamily